mmetsp:Transcript_14821/g.46672  ORF Transcript_14821/g.46672 Transcript_14821/m.46672 type:complete len:224 (+) Transcript_14821:176-847(+)
MPHAQARGWKAACAAPQSLEATNWGLSSFMASWASRISRVTNSLHVGTSSMRATDWPQFQMPLSGSFAEMPSISKSNLTKSPMSGNLSFLPLSCSMRLISAAVLFLKTLEEPLKGFMTMTVERSSAWTMRSLKDWGKMLHSTVALKRVPTCTPAAPKAKAATNCRPVPHPPDAKKGMRKDFLARAMVTKIPTSASPGSPPESKPIKETMSEPSLSCAVSALRT